MFLQGRFFEKEEVVMLPGIICVRIQFVLSGGEQTYLKGWVLLGFAALTANLQVMAVGWLL